MRKCIFCKTGNVTREHVLPAWIFENKINIGEMQPTGYVSPAASPIAVQTFQEKFFERPKSRNNNFVCKCVCKKCNNGWMSHLESKAREFVHATQWGEKAPDLEQFDTDSLLRWMSLKFLIFCQSVGIAKGVDSSLYDRVYRGARIGDVHFDYYLGSHYAIDLSVSQAIPNPLVDKSMKQKLLSNATVFHAQLGKLYLRLFMANFPWRIRLIRVRFNTTSIITDFMSEFHAGDSTKQTPIGTKSEYLLFCQSLMIEPEQSAPT